MWVEKNIDMDGEYLLATNIPTADSLKLTSRATVLPDDPPLPKPVAAETTLKRDDWMLEPTTAAAVPSSIPRKRALPLEDKSLTEDYGEQPHDSRTVVGGVDFFSSLGTERQKKPKVDPTEPRISNMELNTALREGKSLDEYETPPSKAAMPGGPGSQWRMMKLRRVYETAAEEGKPVEEVAIDRFGSLEEFEAAKEERRILDEREGKRSSLKESSYKGKGKEREGEKRFMFTDVSASGASSRSSSFKRPGLGDNTPSTPSPVDRGAKKSQYDSLRLSYKGGTGSPLAQPSHTPVPSVMTPSVILTSGRKRALSPSSLNKLQAKVLRAKLTSTPNADALEKEYEEELRRANGGDDEDDTVLAQVEVLPTLDSYGRMYDVGTGKEDPQLVLPGNRKKKEKVETHDPKTGELVRINADDDTITLGEMLRQERFGAGAADQKNLDAQFARAIATDGGFVADLDYMDDNAERLGRQKMRSDAMKRQFAINDYKKTQKVLTTCPFCYGEDDSLPKAPVIAMGTKAYLSCTQFEELVPGHCLIVPIQHHLTMLEGDDDVWDEVRNFMKSLMRMFAAEDKGVVFYETVLSLKHQKHTFIECVPLSWEHFDEIPGYFKESILMSETEWSQHKKLIDFSARPFRRAMVPNLPYFMVQFDYKGEKGYGHVIEGTGEATEMGDEDNAIDEGAKGSGEFPRYFATEIIGSVLELEPRRWRHPRKMDFRQNRDRVEKFKKQYSQYDWTDMLQKT
ncbi:CwfJ C-terminus 1-domain-containing protein-like protein [Irpex rosettiformis]|uniref:CwfJ C-terminus 1-domain-containing protein-like protein n=1 Tax=Irpex rosettiformis TaxID=378272 RepID=A0ACB8TX89_9APHY|nr:CwfJ C-terminus 1-domain-containing protein-like protein [Irpex rosettiformis]